ncbi:RagB/SusD family nutrient uptake outer membrane protein [Mangrovimonas sp. YM274]|uniref:RagB/SusD family nutrient uptake outer membrane protein n=1 Tax=Mangrovimonas sp. YM274 TaxID=3070660 RepID=UPI0027DCE13D|nr:RagB/SusD family nutrient uptake outer membrane protein [Mangrovimonas sp. YM274]WMI69638.1 RagB/SusD family nutrient uptake outer membrane protein [Mangrovimonas sp. YM274]
MKKISKYLCMALLMGGIYSCDNAINVAPDDEILEENAFTNVDDLERGIYGVYAGISGSNIIQWSSRFTDDLRIAETNRGQGIQVHRWSINPGTDEVGGLWGNMYNVIARANRVLDAMESITPLNEEEEATMQRIKAECLAIRAMEHFDLLRLFAQDYENGSLGVPIIDDVYVFEQFPRNTVGEVFTFVNADLTEAYNLLSASYTDNTRLTRTGINALRARVALYQKDYASAISYSTQVINASPLAMGAEYFGVWTDEVETEVVFKLARTSGDGAVGTIFTDTNDDRFFNISYSLFDYMAANGWTNDIRTFITIDTDNFDVDDLRVGKYLGSDANPGLNDIKVFRTGEQYLIRAEAYARTGSLDLAAQDVEALQNARVYQGGPVTPVSYGSLSNALNDILAERRFELAYEGHRFFDLKRFGLGVNRGADDCADSADPCSLDSTDYRMALPIPSAEIFANDVIQQNTQY